MSFSNIVQKYCTPIPRHERCIMTRKWLDLPKNIMEAFKKMQSPTLSTNVKGIYEYIFCKSMLFLVDIRKELHSLNFNTPNNFISAAWAYFSLLLITVINKPNMTYKEADAIINSIKSYILLYIIVDHTLDSDKTALPKFKDCFSKLFKGEQISFSTLYGEKDNNLSVNGDLQTIPIEEILAKSCALLKDILVNSPKSVPYIADVAKAEFSSVDVQTKEHDKLNMCYVKGSTSTIAGCAVMNNGVIFPGTDLMGKIGQLFDDIVDIDEDLEAGILTYPIKCYKESGNIDTVVTMLGELVEELPENYFKVKKWIYYMLCTFFINMSYISESLRVAILDYSLLLYKGNTGGPKYFAPFFNVFDNYSKQC
jgi:hypothetical protein